jgi:hypothetical protein
MERAIYVCRGNKAVVSQLWMLFMNSFVSSAYQLERSGNVLYVVKGKLSLKRLLYRQRVGNKEKSSLDKKSFRKKQGFVLCG